MKKLDLIIRVGLSILILFILFKKIGFSNVVSNISSVNLSILILILFIFLISLIIGAVNLKILLSPLSKNISFYKIFYYSVLSWAVGLFVPGKIGEFSFVPLLKKEGVRVGHGSAIFILDKLITLVVLSIFSLIGIYLFFDIATFIRLTIITSIIIIAFIFFIFLKVGRNFIKKYFLRGFSEKFRGFFKLISIYIKKEKSLLLLNIIFTFFKWFITSLISYFLFMGYGQDISIVYIFLLNSVLVMVSLIPVSLSGLGVRESMAVFLYSKLSVEPSITFSVFLIQLIIMYPLATIMVLWGLKEIKFKLTSY